MLWPMFHTLSTKESVLRGGGGKRMGKEMDSNLESEGTSGKLT